MTPAQGCCLPARRARSINSTIVGIFSGRGAVICLISASLKCDRMNSQTLNVCHQQSKMRLHGSWRPGYRRTTVECGPHGPTRRP